MAITGGRGNWRDVHAAADAYERRLARALRKAFRKMRDRAPLVDLADAIAARDVSRAVHVMTRIAAEDALAPAGAVLRDAVAKGGRLGSHLVPRG